jgi:mono/diheme cytochrome c family protein
VALRTLRAIGLAALLVALGGCRGCTSSRPPIHLNPNMDRQPKLIAQASSDFFYDGMAMRTPVEGTVAREEPVRIGPAQSGHGPDGAPVARSPVAVTAELVARGEGRFAIYCAPCHGAHGDGHGLLSQRAGVATTDLHEERIRQMPDGQIFETVTNGFGLMQGYGYLVPAHDRWAIIAYLRQLQSGEEAR